MPIFLSVRGSLRRAEVLELVGNQIETINVGAVGILDPNLVVDRRAFDRQMTELAAGGVPLLRRLPHLELLGLDVELGDGALIHHADPGIAVLVDLEVERTERPAFLDDRDRILRHLAGLLIHLAEEHLTEVGIPDVSGLIEHHIVRLDVLVGQVVFGEDDLGRLAREPRQGLELEAPGLLLAQIDGRQPLCDLPAVTATVAIAQEVAGEPLRLQRRLPG